MKQTPLWRSVLLCSSIAAVGPIAAHAQTTTTTTASTSGTLQEVVVTAARRAQNLQKTSIAVTAISGATIQQQAQTNIQEVIQTVPGVTLTTQQRGFSVTIRGQGDDLPPGSGQGTVAVEQDGVYNIRAEGGIIGYYDLARVEVLPGPQGTLYGVNSDGGVVNVISNDPVIGRYAGSASLTIGNYHLHRGEAMVNIPITPVLAFRLAGAAINRLAYLRPAQGDAVGQAARAKLLYKPNDSLSALLGFEFDHIGGVGPNGSLASDYANGDINNDKNPWGNGAYTTSGPNAANSHESEYDKKYWANLSYNLGDIATLSILPAYTRDRDKHQLCGANGPPGSTGPGVCNENYDPKILEQLSSEERISSAPGSKIIWDVGAYHWNYRQVTAGGGPAGYVGQQSNAGFGEITYPVTDLLNIVGGVRESYDHRTELESPGDTIGASWSHFDWRAEVNYQATPTSYEYFTVSTGYRPGGFNQSQTPGGAPSLFKTEQVTSFELGSKNRFFDNTVQLNGDVFYYDEKNYQLLDFYTPDLPACQLPPGSVEPLYCSPPTLNLKAYTYGAEFQARWNVTPDDQFTANGSWLDAKFSDQQNDASCVSTAAGAPAGGCYAGGNDAVGNTALVMFEKLNGLNQPHSPSFSGNFSYQHTVDLASGATVTGAVQIFASTGYWVHPIENPYSYQPTYWTQGLNVTYTAPSSDWSVNAYVRNLSNYAIKEAYIPANISEPRTFGVVGSWHF